ERGGAPTNYAGIDKQFARAQAEVPGWQTTTVRLTGRGPVSFTIDQSHRGRPDKRFTVTVDRRTGDVERVENLASLSLGARVRRYMRFAHTGEIGGVAGQTVAGLASLGGVVLAWTGIALALRRFVSWRKRKSRAATAQQAEAVTAG